MQQSKWQSKYVLGAANDDPKQGAEVHGLRTKTAGACTDNKSRGCFQIRLWTAVADQRKSAKKYEMVGCYSTLQRNKLGWKFVGKGTDFAQHVSKCAELGYTYID